MRRPSDIDDDTVLLRLGNKPSKGTTEASYRNLLHENMALLDRLRKQEDVCRALETKMGDIDTKMDNVADQHLKTLG